MGGGSSKVGAYVCHIQEEDNVEPLKSYWPSAGSSKSSRSHASEGSSQKVVKDRNGNTVLEKAKSSAVLERRNSNSSNASATSAASPSKDMQKAQSSNNLHRRHGNTSGKSQSPVKPNKHGGGNGNTSHQYPWLLKNAKFGGASLKDFEQGRILGRGFMGTVRLVKTKNDKYCVFKCVKKDAAHKKRAVKHINGEKLALSTINNCFCIKLFGTFQDKQNLYFALEYAVGGELCHHLDRKHFFEPEVAKFYISEVFVALEHVQSLGFVYRDLKPENVMLDEEGHCKLVDFGFTCAANSATGKLHTMCGTAAYLSPEQLDGKFTNGYTNIVDWWSFGVLIYELRTGNTPFCRSNQDTNYEIFLRILKKKISFPYSFDKSSKDLIKNLCYADVNKRLCDPENIKKQEYFTVPWSAVQERRLVPPIKPKVTTVGDSQNFPRMFDPSAALPNGDGAAVADSGSTETTETGISPGGEFFDF